MTYPNESWPTDVDVQGLDGTTDADTGLPYIAKGTGPGSVPSYEVQYNRREQRLNRILAGWRQGMVVWEGGLRIGVYPVEFTQGGYRRVFDGATGVTLPDNAIKVVYIDASTQLRVGDIWPADLSTYLPLALVATADGRVSIADKRVWAAFHVPASGGSAAEDRRLLSAHRSVVGDSQNGLKIFEFDPPENLVLEEVQVFCSDAVETTTVDVRESGVSMLAAAAVPSAGAVVKPTISDGSVPATGSLSVHVSTDGSGFISDLTVTLLLRAA